MRLEERNVVRRVPRQLDDGDAARTAAGGDLRALDGRVVDKEEGGRAEAEVGRESLDVGGFWLPIGLDRDDVLEAET